MDMTFLHDYNFRFREGKSTVQRVIVSTGRNYPSINPFIVHYYLSLPQFVQNAGDKALKPFNHESTIEKIEQIDLFLFHRQLHAIFYFVIHAMPIRFNKDIGDGYKKRFSALGTGATSHGDAVFIHRGWKSAMSTVNIKSS
jgi:hypothetical protein